MPGTSARPTTRWEEYNRRVAERRRLRRIRRIRNGIIAFLVLVFLIVGIVLLRKGCSADRSIVGTWDYDTVTVYRFDMDGKGALELPNGSYEFSYKIDGNMLTIDFENASATDSIYAYTVTNDTLTLASEDGRTVEMKKVQ